MAVSVRAEIGEHRAIPMSQSETLGFDYALYHPIPEME